MLRRGTGIGASSLTADKGSAAPEGLGTGAPVAIELDKRQRAHVMGAITERKRRHIAFVGAQPSDMPPSRPPVGGDLQTFRPSPTLAMAKTGSCCYLVKRAPRLEYA